MSEAMKDDIIRQIQELFGDTSVSPETTADHMKEIKMVCDEQLEALRGDGVDC
jgi:hypothetical protein